MFSKVASCRNDGDSITLSPTNASCFDSFLVIFYPISTQYEHRYQRGTLRKVFHQNAKHENRSDSGRVLHLAQKGFSHVHVEKRYDTSLIQAVLYVDDLNKVVEVA